MSRKFLSFVLAAVLCVGVVQVSYAADSDPTYIIGAEPSDGGYTVTISIANASATVGRFALEYDTETVTLLDKNGVEPENVSPLVKDVVSANADNITIPAQNGSDGQGVSVTDGYVMFAWYASGTRVEATDGEEEIAYIRFALNDGVTEGDFNSTTFRLRTIAEGVYPGWWSGAQIATGSYSHFWNNVDGFGQCAIEKRYANCDVLPIVTYDVAFGVTDGEGSAVADAVVVLDSTEYQTGSDGKVTAELPVGDYGYTVSKSGYESRSGIVSVTNGDVSENVVIRTDLQYVTEEINNVAIVYADGDSAAGVTTSVGLPFDDISGASLTWVSSNTDVITDSGAVIRPKSDTQVTLTLTMSRGDAQVSRDFVLTVLKKGEVSTPSNNGGGGGGGTPSNKDDEDEEPTVEDVDAKDDLDKGEGNADEVTDKVTESVSVPNFKDIDSYGWAKDAIMSLAKDGVIKGTSDTTFEPGKAIKRGDFVTLLVRMFGLEAEVEGNFDDVAQDSYYYNEIAIAKALGIAQGSDDGNFMPESNISRQDMMVIVHRAMKLYDMPLKGVSGDVLDGFTDKAGISDYAVSAVGELVGNGLISGNDDNELSPLGLTTRAEVAVFLHRINKI